ncbi:DUF4493 domain-containing protein [Parabacteroides bouchesdurhonensis]|uniref:DUF4493 domain-containing protein n=1 Tax=Parabacteroides bouchesdurhonensis TaxID=1936995 RepID=UPI000E4D9AF6|nr:DUF4493 domain-containing protein [Parabacteroides bouchesdurhonensis]RHJ94159.1 DUF4493 domain-containing protein [Bacteroides sp. AM07-16]
MQRLIQYIYACCCVLLFMFVSCNDDKSGLAPCGTLCLNVNQDETVLTKAQSTVVNESLRVDVIAASGDTIKSYNDYVKEVQNEKLVLPVGTYTVSVVSNQSKDAGWEKPFYAGEETVEVKAGEITSATVICKIANAKVTVVYTDGVKENFVNYETTVSNSSGSLLYTRDEYRAGYFTPEKLTASLALTNNDGKAYTFRQVFTDIKPRYHYTIKYKMGDKPGSPEGGGDFNITVDDEAKVVECEVVIDESDMEGQKVPVIKLSDTFNENMLSIKVGDNLPSSSLQITSQVGIETLTVKAESDLFAAVGLDLFDLTKPDEMTKNKLGGLGFPLLPGDQDMKDITLNFDALAGTFLQDIAYLQSKKLHTFTVYAMDSLHQETEIKFVYEARPNVSILTNKPNAFSTFAFLYGESQEASGHAFEFRKQGDIEFKTIEATQVNTDGTFSALVTSLIPGQTYEYRAVAGTDSEGDLVSFKTEGAVELPGGKFDEWNGNNPANSFWSSGNNTFAGDLLSPTDDVVGNVNSIKAASLQSKYATVKFAAGNLFTGDFNLSGTTGYIKVGRLFSARPTKLKGWYKYSPGNIDYSGEITTPSGRKINVQGMDTCSVFIVLLKNTFTINSNDQSTFFDLETDWFKENVIAYAELPSSQCVETKDYTQFELTLNYFYPDYNTSYYLAIICSASKYGDYFKGGTKSNLKLDEFELLYDYDPKCFSNE